MAFQLLANGKSKESKARGRHDQMEVQGGRTTEDVVPGAHAS